MDYGKFLSDRRGVFVGLILHPHGLFEILFRLMKPSLFPETSTQQLGRFDRLLAIFNGHLELLDGAVVEPHLPACQPHSVIEIGVDFIGDYGLLQFFEYLLEPEELIRRDFVDPLQLQRFLRDQLGSEVEGGVILFPLSIQKGFFLRNNGGNAYLGSCQGIGAGLLFRRLNEIGRGLVLLFLGGDLGFQFTDSVPELRNLLSPPPPFVMFDHQLILGYGIGQKSCLPEYFRHFQVHLNQVWADG